MTSVISVRLAMLASAKAVLGAMVAPTMHLYVGAVAWSEDTVLSDITEATFGGYLAIAGCVWSDPYVDALTGKVQFRIPTKTFVATDSVTPQLVAGWYATDAAGTGLYGGAQFPAPQPMNANHDACNVDAVYTFGG
jgi:hypothetical protein